MIYSIFYDLSMSGFSNVVETASASVIFEHWMIKSEVLCPFEIILRRHSHSWQIQCTKKRKKRKPLTLNQKIPFLKNVSFKPDKSLPPIILQILKMLGNVTITCLKCQFVHRHESIVFKKSVSEVESWHLRRVPSLIKLSH